MRNEWETTLFSLDTAVRLLKQDVTKRDQRIAALEAQNAKLLALVREVAALQVWHSIRDDAAALLAELEDSK